MLIAMLAAFTGPGEPLNAEVIVRSLCECVRYCHIRIDDSNDHSAGVNPAPFLGRWHTLNTVATCFLLEDVETFALDLKGYLIMARVTWPLPDDAGLSTLAGRQLRIGCNQVLHENLSVSAALTCSYFYDFFHRFSPVAENTANHIYH